MSAIDDTIAELRAARDAQANALQAAREHIIAGERELAVIDAKLWGLEHARDLFVPAEPEKVRHDVQGPVMRLFGSAGGVRSERAVIEMTELPPESVHKFLLRAVREGKLLCLNGVYSLPPAESARAAE